jgi:hypothetical protein
MTEIENSDSIYGQADVDASTPEAPFYGASTFMRRPYRRDLDGVDVAPDNDHAEISVLNVGQLALEYLCLRAAEQE